MYTRKVPLFGDIQKNGDRLRRSFLSFVRLYGYSSTSLTLSLYRAKDGSRTRNLQLGRLELYQLSYFRLILLQCDNHCLACGDRRIRTSEARATDLQSVPFGHSGISPIKSRRRDSNPRPTDYKSVALPAELLRLNFLLLKNVPF